jgi:hypothetical protein
MNKLLMEKEEQLREQEAQIKLVDLRVTFSNRPRIGEQPRSSSLRDLKERVIRKEK